MAPLRRNTEETNIRDKELLASFLKNENHQQSNATMVTSNSAQEITPKKKEMPRMPEIPLPTVREIPGQKKQKIKKPKLTTAAFKEGLMRRTYKIRFHVNLDKVQAGRAEKPSVLQSFLK